MFRKPIARVTAIVLAIGLCAGVAQAFQEKKADPKPAVSLTGKWTLTTSGGPHGAATMGLVFKHEGKTVTATLATGHSEDIQLEGEFIDGTLTLASKVADDGSKLTATATLKADGKLSGFLSSVMGDMTWTAERAK